MQKCWAQKVPIGLRASTRSPRPLIAALVFRRGLQDVSISRTGKPIIRIQGGRSSLGGIPAQWPLQDYVDQHQDIPQQSSELQVSWVAISFTVVVPFREEMAKRHLKVTGDLGRVVFMEYDLRNTASLEESVRHSDVVYNLVGRDYPTKNFDLEDVHVEGAERIAEAVAKYDVDRFIHVSSYNANKNSPSEFFRTKARGEEVVRNIFPETTIVRPAPLFGFEDRLLHKLAGVTNLFTSNHMQERFWPVHAVDVGTALSLLLEDDNTASETFELYGPTNYSMAEIAELVDKEIYKKRRHLNIPKRLLKPAAKYLNRFLWWKTTSADEVEREFLDQEIDPKAKTFKDLAMEPAELKNYTFHYLQGYRSSAFYDLPPATEREKREEKKYLHVIDDQ
ncbi:MAG: NADH-ubiquinone oxidoreductase 40 kDa subunit [Alectoria sarmentosa]|nr:MAG: NADH-ubiquinone oxidoreductase 40 kDa subunit [Alectoria sarmentosa]